VKFFLPTLVEVSSSVLKLEKKEIFLLQWVEVGGSDETNMAIVLKLAKWKGGNY